jgi:DNA-binding MarR family transcriptional regulator
MDAGKRTGRSRNSDAGVVKGAEYKAPECQDIAQIISDLAAFRYALRKFVRFSENAARSCGVTPQQHQLMLGVAGFTGRGVATVSELAEFLQERVHSIVGLVERAEQNGLVSTRKSRTDGRVVVVSLSGRGGKILSHLAEIHHEQSKRLRALLYLPKVRRPSGKADVGTSGSGPLNSKSGVTPSRKVRKEVRSA